MREEALLAKLRALYEGAGFRAYKMRKFEEYSLYLENRDFLTSEYVIAFSDLSGRLLALKPDVTLSIVKGTRATRESGEKLYYLESVYRLDPRAHEYREIRQMGLESLGEIDGVQTLEVCQLAFQSLSEIDENALMDFSHMGYLRACLARAGAGARTEKKALDALRGKNKGALAAACAEIGCGRADEARLFSLMELDGNFEKGLKTLFALADGDDMKNGAREMEELYEGLCALGASERARLDFSIANDLNYYTGIVFQGYVRGAHKAVLSGGRYDGLTEKFNRGVGALGFAIYLSDIAPAREDDVPDADALLLYEPGADPARALEEARRLRARGLRVRVETRAPEGKKYGEIREVK